MKNKIKHVSSILMVLLFLFIAIGSDDDETIENNEYDSTESLYETPKSTSIDGNYSSSVSGGGAGGEWALAGGDTNNTGDGGTAGKAIAGTSYSVIGSISSTTLKGDYPATP